MLEFKDFDEVPQQFENSCTVIDHELHEDSCKLVAKWKATKGKLDSVSTI